MVSGRDVSGSLPSPFAPTCGHVSSAQIHLPIPLLPFSAYFWGLYVSSSRPICTNTGDRWCKLGDGGVCQRLKETELQHRWFHPEAAKHALLTRGVQCRFVSIKMLPGIHSRWLVLEIKGCQATWQTFLKILMQENGPEGRGNKNCVDGSGWGLGLTRGNKKETKKTESRGEDRIYRNKKQRMRKWNMALK